MVCGEVEALLLYFGFSFFNGFSIEGLAMDQWSSAIALPPHFSFVLVPKAAITVVFFNGFIGDSTPLLKQKRHTVRLEKINRKVGK